MKKNIPLLILLFIFLIIPVPAFASFSIPTFQDVLLFLARALAIWTIAVISIVGITVWANKKMPLKWALVLNSLPYLGLFALMIPLFFQPGEDFTIWYLVRLMVFTAPVHFFVTYVVLKTLYYTKSSVAVKTGVLIAFIVAVGILYSGYFIANLPGGNLPDNGRPRIITLTPTPSLTPGVNNDSTNYFPR